MLRCHEHSEILLELHLMDYCSLQTKTEDLKTQLQTAEESVMLRLDTSRNQLLVTDAVLSVMTLAVGMGSFIGSIFGMNLSSNMENGPYQFKAVALGTTVLMLLFVVITIHIFQRKGIIPSSYGLTPVNNGWI